MDKKRSAPMDELRDDFADFFSDEISRSIEEKNGISRRYKREYDGEITEEVKKTVRLALEDILTVINYPYKLKSVLIIKEGAYIVIAFTPIISN